MAAFDGTLYNSWGLDSKPKTKIDEVIDAKWDESTFKTIQHNTTHFKLINNIT